MEEIDSFDDSMSQSHESPTTHNMFPTPPPSIPLKNQTIHSFFGKHRIRQLQEDQNLVLQVYWAFLDAKFVRFGKYSYRIVITMLSFLY